MTSGYAKIAKKNNIFFLFEFHINNEIMIGFRDIGVDTRKPILGFMIKDVEFVRDSDSIINVIRKICKNGYRRYPVVARRKSLTRMKEEVVGIVTAMDILNAFLRGIDLDKPICDIMSRDIVYCEPEDTLQLAVRKFQFARRGGFPVLNKNKGLEGIITEHDIIKLFKGHEFNATVDEIMTHKPFFIKPMSFWNSLNILVNTKYRKIPLVENGKIAGLLTERLCLDVLLRNDFKKEKLNFLNKDIAIKDIYLVHPGSDLLEAVDLMIKYRVGGVLVSKERSPVGILTERDIIERF
jgi:CBS domain-containing protein